MSVPNVIIIIIIINNARRALACSG